VGAAYAADEGEELKRQVPGGQGGLGVWGGMQKKANLPENKKNQEGKSGKATREKDGAGGSTVLGWLGSTMEQVFRVGGMDETLVLLGVNEGSKKGEGTEPEGKKKKLGGTSKLGS